MRRIIKEFEDYFIIEYEVGHGKCVLRRPVVDHLRGDHAVWIGKIPGVDYVAGAEFMPRKGTFLFGLVFGRTGMGKSTLLKMLATELMNYGWGLFMIDPHGTLMRDTLKMVPKHRLLDTIVFDPLAIQKYGRLVPFNPLVFETSKEKMVVREDIVTMLGSVFHTQIGSRMAQITELIADVLVSAAEDLELSKVCLQDAYWVLASKQRREELLKYVPSEIETEARTKLGDMDLSSADASMLSMSAVGSVLDRLRPLVRSIIAPLFKYADNFVSPRQIIDDGLLVFANLAKGELREEASSLLQTIFTRFMFSAAITPSRARGRVVPFFFIVDEAHNYDLSIFTKVFAEGRKYVIGAVLVTQSPTQMAEQVHETAVLSQLIDNVWWGISFNLSVSSSVLAKLFGSYAEEIPSLPAYRFIYAGKFIEGGQIVPVDPYTLETIVLKDLWSEEEVEGLIRFVLEFWGVRAEEFKREEVEKISDKFRAVLKELRALGRFSAREAIETIQKVFNRPYGTARRWFRLLLSDNLIVCDDVDSCYVPQFVAVTIEAHKVKEKEEVSAVPEEVVPFEVPDRESLLEIAKKGKELQKRLESISAQVSSEMKIADVEELSNEELERVLRGLLHRGGEVVEKDGRTYFVVRVRELIEGDSILKTTNPELWKYAIENLEDMHYQLIRVEDAESGNIDWDAHGYIVIGESVVVPDTLLRLGRPLFMLVTGDEGYSLVEFEDEEGGENEEEEVLIENMGERGGG